MKFIFWAKELIYKLFESQAQADACAKIGAQDVPSMIRLSAAAANDSQFLVKFDLQRVQSLSLIEDTMILQLLTALHMMASLG
jgi:hypothetical protein